MLVRQSTFKKCPFLSQINLNTLDVPFKTITILSKWLKLNVLSWCQVSDRTPSEGSLHWYVSEWLTKLHSQFLLVTIYGFTSAISTKQQELKWLQNGRLLMWWRKLFLLYFGAIEAMLNPTIPTQRNCPRTTRAV